VEGLGISARLGVLVALAALVVGALALIADLTGSATARSQPTLPAAAPVAPPAGATAAALWLRDPSRSPAEALAAFSAAGIPVVVVHDAASAFARSLVVAWPTTRMSAGEVALARRYARAGGLLLAVAPDARTTRALGPAAGLAIPRLARVDDAGSPRDLQIGLLRRLYEASPAGFHLGDAPDGRSRAVVLLPHGDAGVPGIADVSLKADAAGGSFPLWSGTFTAPRLPLRFPVAASAADGVSSDASAHALLAAASARSATGAPSVLGLPAAGAAGVQQAVLAGLPGDVWTGSLGDLATFWRDRTRTGVDAEPAGQPKTWRVTLRSAGADSPQTLVAPRQVLSATGPSGAALAVSGGRRIALPAFDRALVVRVVER
jgi:hypothetical protein